MKKAICALLALCMLSMSLIGCAEAALPRTEIPILQEEEIKYTDEKINTSVALLYDAATSISNKIPEAFALRTFLKSIVLCFEKREVSTRELDAVTSIICADKALISSMVSAIGQDSALSLDALISFFGTLSLTVGAQTASLLIYDITVLYMSQMADFYETLYIKNNSPAFAYLLQERDLWDGYAASLSSLGERDFASLIRLFVSVSTYDSVREGSTAGFISGLSAGELLILLKSEGALIKSITAEGEDIEFLLTFAANECESITAAAIIAAGDTQRYSAAISGITEILGDVICRLDAQAAEQLKSGNMSASAHALMSSMTDAEFDALTGFFESEPDEQVYYTYLKTNRLYEKYIIFKGKINSVSKEELRTASPADFSEKFSDYVNSTSPILGFLISESAERSPK